MAKYIDLTAPLNDGDPGMPMDPKISISWHCTLDTLGYNLSRLTTSLHQGTHIDAPKHFFKDGETIDHIALDRVIVRAIKIALPEKTNKTFIHPEDLEPYADKIKPGMAVLLHTGWDKKFPDQVFFNEFPSITAETAQWLADHKVGIIGMDMPTPGSDWKVVHETLLGNDVLVVEGLANMEDITADEFTFLALPLKLAGRSGSPIRAVAIED